MLIPAGLVAAKQEPATPGPGRELAEPAHKTAEAADEPAEPAAEMTEPTDEPAGPPYEIADPAFLYSDNCLTRVGPFAPTVSPDGTPASRVLYGIKKGAAYHIEVPLNWNGEVVVWAHGYNGNGLLLCAGMPSLREHFIRTGYAWAASSYRTNGYDVATAVRDSREVLRIFSADVATPARAYMTGDSMGGHITAVAIEAYRGVFDGAMSVCGVLGDAKLFDYFLDANVTAAALAGAPKPLFPVDPTAYASYVAGSVLPPLGRRTPGGGLRPTAPAGLAWRAAVAQQSGGPRPGFNSAFGFWNGVVDPATKLPFFFAVYPGTSADTIGWAGSTVTDNSATIYQLDGDPAVSVAEQALNDAVLRVEAGSTGDIPRVKGDPQIPVMSLHGLGDLLVPFSMEQVYAQRVAQRGDQELLTQRAIRATLHCDFTPEELRAAFDDLVAHVKTDTRPAGDDVLNPAAVADPRFGCAFSRGPHPNFTAQAGCN
jgi:hypothetical protein